MKINKPSEFLDSNGKTIFENDYIKIVRTRDNVVLAAQERVVFWDNIWQYQSLISYERGELKKLIEATKEGRLKIYVVGNYLTEKI